MYTDKKQQELRKELGERIKDVTTKVVAGLREAGHDVQTVPRAVMVGGVECESIHKVDGVFTEMRIAAQQRGGRGGWSTHYNGKLTMSLGSYPETKSYPEPKAGFDIAKTVERIQEYVAYRKRVSEAAAKHQEVIKATKSLADQVQEAMCKHLDEDDLVRVSYTHRHGGHLPAVTIEMNLLEAQAVAALLGSMRKGKNVVTEAEAYGDEDGQAGAESGVEYEGT